MKKEKLLYVDDQALLSRTLKDVLEDFGGYKVFHALDANEARSILFNEKDISCAILDVMLPIDHETDPLESQGGHRMGCVLAKWMKENYPHIPIIGYSARDDEETINYFRTIGEGYFVKPVDPRSLLRKIDRILIESSPYCNLKTFIVHGHDEKSKYELKDYLQNVLKIPEPIILHEQPSKGLTIIEKFEQLASDVDMVFVLLTPDDLGVAESSKDDSKRLRARQNVIFELGYFLGKLKRSNASIVLLHKGDLEIPSDLSGVIYINISDGIEPIGELIKKEIDAYLST